MIVRGDSLERSMSSYLIDQIRAIENIEVRLNTSVLTCAGQDHLECVTLANWADGSQEVVEAAHLFVFIGAAPLTDWLTACRGAGRGPDLWLPVRIWSLTAGDRGAGISTAIRICWSPASPACSPPATSGPNQSSVASAVGEGALAVTLVHRYLAEQ